MKIRITDVPPGDAPEWVRRSWVGLVLPVAPGQNRPRALPTAGVLTGPRGCAAALAHFLLGRSDWHRGYLTDARTAVWLLAEKDLEAAEWWRENAPHMPCSGKCFLFPEEVCREEWRDGRPPAAGGDGITL